MKKLMILFALILGVVSVKAQSNDLYQGITKKLPYRQMVTPYGVQVTFAKTVHIIFPSAVKYVDLGSNYIIAGKADGAENVVRVKATTEGFPGETNFSVICEDGSFYSFNAKYAHEPEMLNIEMKDFLENEDTTDFSHTRMNIYFRELKNESPLLVKLIMQSVYKNNDREIKHLGCKRFGVQFLVKGIYSHNGLFYFHTQTRNSSNVPFDTDFIRFKIVDKKITLCDLQGMLDKFVQAIFGSEVKTRLRPSYFPFTEPSVEVDVSCFECGGKGCPLCKHTGWIEVLGGGIVHHKVLENCGIDPNEYSGLAFGIGIERIAMLKYGINNINLLYENDLRFLKQFKG